jgi:hypothetical protein
VQSHVVAVGALVCLAAASARAESSGASEGSEHTDLVGQNPIETPPSKVTVEDDRLVEHVASSAGDDDVFSDVVLVGNERAFWCSGVLVDPHHVLTASHCAAATRVGFGNDAQGAQHVRVVGTHVHPRLDVAVLELGARADIHTHPRRSSADTTPPAGTIRVLGFGARDPLHLTGFGTKRQLDLAIDGWGCTRARVAALGCHADDELIMRGGVGNDTCLGDSGGPVFERVDSSWRLLAITSRGLRPRKVVCGEGGIYVRVDRISTWLESILK